MKRTLLTLLATYAVMVMNATTVNYTADNTTIFRNPERGYYVEFDKVVGEDGIYTCVKHRDTELKDSYVTPDNLSLVLVLYYLDNFKTTETLPEEVFTGFEEDMQTLRGMGLKCILRFAYTADDSDDIGRDAKLDIVKKHIAQYTSHWKANADVIYVFQAGFVGCWGEWYYTENFDNKSDQMTEKRRALVDTLLKAVPENRFIQLRTPKFKSEYLYGMNQDKYTEPLTKSEAYQNTPKARLGHHNDAFLWGPKNMGTYSDTAKQKPYLAKETLYVPIGGETDITDKNKVKEWASREKTIAEMSRLHWTFIQGYYSQTVTDEWRKPSNGTFDELNRRMGYRYQLVNGTYGDEVEQGKQLSVNLQIKNVGFAPLYNERHAYMVLKGEGTNQCNLQLASDPRGWLPNGAVTTIDESLTIPADLPEGTYHLYLYMPDIYESLADNSYFAIRFANSDVWDAATGWNDLGTTVTVKKASGGDPDPDPQPGETVELPGTLTKANVTAYSDDMTWYNTDYFDFGPTDGENLDRWAKWNVELKYPGKYIISENMKSASAYDSGSGTWFLLGHSWQLQLFPETGSAVSSYTTEAVWEEGTIQYDAKWDLSDVDAGVYMLQVQNVTPGAQPKLQSLTLTYDGDIPTDQQDLRETNDLNDLDDQGYDILGRPVDQSYKGIILLKGKKIVRF